MSVKLFYTLIGLGLLAQLGCSDKRDLSAVIVGSSMAPTLLGEHWEFNCQDCQFPNRFDLPASPRASELVVCSNCGFQQSFQKNQSRQPAQKVAVQPANSFHRWDLIAFRIPGRQQLGIKRIAGLPRETIEIRRGKIYVEGQLQKKTWNQQREVRILVHDSAYIPDSIDLPRWESLNPRSSEGWESTSSHWNFRSPKENPLPAASDPMETALNLHWLGYRHWRGCRHSGSRTLQFPIEDLDAYNQGLSRHLNPTAELMLELDGQFDSGPLLGFRFFRGSHELLLLLNLRKREGCLRTAEAKFPTVSSQQKGAMAEAPFDTFRWMLDPQNIQKIEVSTFDEQLTVAFNGIPVTQFNIPPANDRFDVQQLLQIGALRGDLQLGRIRIYRDIYYLPANSGEASDRRLTADRDHFLLIGDNVPVSNDSRHWRDGGIPSRLILGKIVDLDSKSRVVD